MRERIKNNLIKCIKVGGVGDTTYEEMGSGEDMSQKFPLIPPTKPTVPLNGNRSRVCGFERESTTWP